MDCALTREGYNQYSRLVTCSCTLSQPYNYCLVPRLLCQAANCLQSITVQRENNPHIHNLKINICAYLNNVQYNLQGCPLQGVFAFFLVSTQKCISKAEACEEKRSKQ